MSACKRCGSHAINPHLHGRDTSDIDLCDVCYWRRRAETGEMNETEDMLEAKNEAAIRDHYTGELALGFLRYKKLRTFTPRAFMELWTHCLKTGVRFDDEIDKLIIQ